MKHQATASILALAITIATASSAFADQRECAMAGEHLASAKSRVFSAIHTYGDCVSTTDGREECESEFSLLQSAQNKYESAISNFSQDCE